jgi:hypothetical protein
MKTMKNNKMISMLLSLVLIVCSTGLLQAQQSESLKRDMEVTSNLLSTLLKTNTGNSLMRVGTDGIETSYNEGFGVVYDLKGNTYVYLSTSGVFMGTPPPNPNEVVIEMEDNSRSLSGTAATSVSRGQGYVVSSTGRVQGASSLSASREVSEANTESSIKEFLIEYGSFLKDLKPDEKIMVQYPYRKMESQQSGNDDNVTVFNYFSNSKGTRSFSIQKKDADAYRNGSISKEEALSRITVEENLPEEIATDLKVLGELMNSLYSERSSKSYFSTSNPSIVRTKGMGAVYSWAVYSGYNDNFGYRLPTLVRGEQSVDENNRNEIVKAAYPAFLESFKENLVDYGRTIKSLENNEKIVFNIKMTRCQGCGIPDVLKVEMDKATIEEYNQGKLSRSQAISRLKVIEN